MALTCASVDCSRANFSTIILKSILALTHVALIEGYGDLAHVCRDVKKLTKGGYRLVVVVHLEVHLAQGRVGAVAQWIDLEGFFTEGLCTCRVALRMQQGSGLVYNWEDVDGRGPAYK